MDLTEVFALLALIVGLLTLMVDIVRLTFEVNIKLYGKKDRENKKIDCPATNSQSIFWQNG